MLHRIFSVYDSKAAVYLPIFTFRNRGEALRAFMDTCADRNHQFNRHASDFTLFAFGEFDDNTGEITTFPTPEPIAKAIELIGEKNGELFTDSDETRLLDGAERGDTPQLV